ncbi:MAG: N-acetylglucosamine-6-phosphate deacetylase [Planctomycetota bacterium]|nr:N-acetylglucosamine-6-phosphate deacetylase [Planctomycetota bacterium]
MELAVDRVALPCHLGIGNRIAIADGRIETIDQRPPGPEARRLQGTLLPGFIDLQVNGGGGRSVDEAVPEALDIVADSVWAGGSVAFLPTLITAPWGQLLDQVRAVAAWIDSWTGTGAQPLGLHVEGPFLSVGGAHDPECFVDPTPERIEALLDAAGGHLRLLTLANDRTGAVAAVEQLRQANVCVSLGHVAKPSNLEDCVAAGARLVTHLFNAMQPMHHRENCVPGMALDNPRLCCAMIADGAHVHRSMLRNAFAILGPDRLVLTSDAVAAAGMPDGDYFLAGKPLHSKDGVVRDSDQRLAGSALTLGKAATNFLAWMPETSAWTLSRIASSNPARLLGNQDFGAIREGMSAAFTLLEDDGSVTAMRV